MVTLKIAGLVIVFVLGFLFAPTYFDFSAPGAALRRMIHAFRQNPAYPVGMVIAIITLIPVGMLVGHLMILGSAGAIVIAYVVEFLAMALVGAAITPAPSFLGFNTKGEKKKSLLELVEE